MFKYPQENDEMTDEQRFQKRVLERLSALETHIVNLIHPLQTLNGNILNKGYLQKLEDILSNPLMIDDTRLRPYLDNFMKEIREFSKNNDNLSQTFQEIKYIGKRLYEIEERLKKIEEGGKKNQLTLSVNYNGKDWIEKDKNQDALAHPDIKTPPKLDIEKILTERELLVYQMREGLNGYARNTFVKMAPKIGISSGRCQQIYTKVCRKILRAKRIKA